MLRHLKDADVALTYNPKFREYGIRVQDGGTSVGLQGVRARCQHFDAWLTRLEAL